MNKYFLFIVVCFFLLFFQTFALSSTKSIDYRWFWMFYEQEHVENRKTDVVRPIYLKNRYESSVFKTYFMPLGYWETKNKKSTRWNGLFGFTGAIDYKHSNGVKDYDFAAFPLLYYGNSKNKKDQYLAVWPIGGKLKGKFALDEITFYGFPSIFLFVFYPPATFFSLQTGVYLVASMIPLYATYKKNDYSGMTILWPLITIGSGEKRKDFRILPFYSSSHKKNRYDSYSYFMIINYKKSYTLKDETRTFFLFPFYGFKRTNSGNLKSTTVLWPFFSWGYNKKNEDYQYNLPWPIVQIQDSKTPKIKKRIFFPFYGFHNYGGNKMKFVTPFYINLEKKAKSFNSDYYTIMLIFWYHKRDYKKSHKYYGKEWRYFKVWPLFNVEYNDKGDFSFRMVSIFPFRDPDGYEKLYSPFWSLIEYKKIGNKEKRFGFLMRTYFQRWGDDFYEMKIPFVVSLKRVKGNFCNFTFLFDAFGYVREKNRSSIKFFWFKFNLFEDKKTDESVCLNKSVKLKSKISYKKISYLDLNEKLYLGNIDSIYYKKRVF